MKKLKLLFTLFSLISLQISAQQCMNITGNPNRVTVGEIDVPGSQITVEALIKITGAGTNIVSKHTNTADCNYLLRAATFEITTTSGFLAMVNPYSMNTNQWYHVAGTYDGAYVKYYVNGCLVIQQAWNGALVQNNWETCIGNMSSAPYAEGFVGEIDEVRIWNVARTETEISANMTNLVNPTTYPNLLGYYKFEGNYNNELVGNNGVNIGASIIAQTGAMPVPFEISSVTVVDNTNCTGGPNGSITINANPTTGVTYSIDGTTYQASNVFSNLAAGTYTAFARTVEGCFLMENVTVINDFPTITLTPTSTDITCFGAADGTASVTASGGGPHTYSWNTSPVQTTSSVSGLSAGTYTVTVTGSGGCTETESFTITEPTVLTVSTTETNVLCNGGSTGSSTATASGGTTPYSFGWNTTPPQTTATATNLPAGSYIVVVMDANGCIAQANVTITEPPVLAVTTATTQTSCTADDGTATVNATGGTSPYTYSWNSTPVQTAAIATNLAAGSYVVTVTDANGCQVNGNADVTVVPSPTISITAIQNVTCNGDTDGSGTVSASGGNAPYTYSWSPSGGTGTTATGLSPGSYDVTVTDASGCSDMTTIVINEPNEITINANITDVYCKLLDDGTISLTVSGGNGGYTYNWTPGVSTSNTASNLAMGTYDVQVVDAQGCSASGSFVVDADTIFDINVIPNEIAIDRESSITLTIDVETGYTLDTIIWTPSESLSCSDCPDPVASPLDTTIYYVVSYTDDGCVAMDTVVINVIPPCGELFVPTIFSPNGDGLNDLECVMGSCVISAEFTIFDRWGETVFKTTDINNCWDGSFRGKPVQAGAYVYKVVATLNTGEVVKQSGSLSVTR